MALLLCGGHLLLRNGGKWTQARFNSFIKSGLRAMSRRWGPKFECLADACVGTKTNKATGRMAKHYECAECHNQFPAKEVAVDHIDPVVPVSGFTTWDEVIERMFVEKEGLQVLCKECHQVKCQEEKQQRKQAKG
jgi:hypothetical protein